MPFLLRMLWKLILIDNVLSIDISTLHLFTISIPGVDELIIHPLIQPIGPDHLYRVLGLTLIFPLGTIYLYVGFKVLTPVVMKSYILWDITPDSPLKVKRRLGGRCYLHLQVRRIS
jgi:hypothetical protein